MSKYPEISKSEWLVMQVLWQKSPIKASEIIEKLSDEVTWEPKTIKSLLNRLIKKQAVGFKNDAQDKRAYLYYPLVSEKEYAKKETKSFIKRVYGGALDLMVANLLEDDELSEDEIEELKRMLDKQEERGE